MKEITFTEMQVGHKTAYSRGGSTTMRNAVCLCYACNKLQGTDSWATFQKKIGRDNGNSITSKNTDSLNS
ncbi:MAG: HNH endonuclease, partial [Nitrososphaera sp.]